MSVASLNDNEALLIALHRGGVEYIVVGGMAAIVHGAARLTFDLDIVYKRSRENYQRLVAALAEFGPYLRGAPPGLPFRWDVGTIERGLNFTLITSLAPLIFWGKLPVAATINYFLIPN